MATEDILIRYRADVSQLEGDINKVIQSQEELTQATQQNTQAQQKAVTSAEFAAKKRAQLLDLEVQKLKQLQAAQKLAFDPKEIQKYNDQIASTQKRIELLGGTYQTAANKINKAQDDINKGFDGTLNQLNKIGSAFGIAFSVEALVNFGRQAVNAFLDAEAASSKLRFAITEIGNEGEDAFQRLSDQADRFQETSIFDADEIRKAQAALAEFGLTSQQIEQAIPGLIDYASKNEDLLGSVNAVGSALEGRAGEFRAYGLEVDANATKQENLNKVLNTFVRFQGNAEEKLKTTEGQLKQTQNATEDYIEAIGKGIVVYINEFAKFASELVTPLIDAVKQLGNALANLIPEPLLNKLKELGDGTSALGIAFKVINAPIILAAKAFGIFLEAATKVAGAIGGLVNVFKVGFQEIGNTVSSVGGGIADTLDGIADFDSNKIKAGLGKVKGAFSQAGVDLADAFNKGYDDTLKVVQSTSNAVAAADDKILSSVEIRKKSTKELTAELEKQKQLQGNAARQNVEAIEKELELRKKQADAAKKAADEAAKIEADRQKAIADTFAKAADEFIKLRNEADQALKDIEFTITLNTKGLAPAIEQFQKTAADDLTAAIQQLQTQIDANPLAFDALTNEQKQALLLKQFKAFVGQIDQAWAAGGVSIEDTSTNIAAALGPDFLALPFEEAIKLLPQLAAQYLPQFKGQFKDTADEVKTDADKIAEANKEASDNYAKSWIGRNEEILESFKTLFSELNDLFQNITDSRLKQIQEQTDAELEALDLREEANKEQLDNRAVSEREFLEEQTRIENEKIAVQEEAAAREKELKRQQFAAQQAIAIFEIGLSTAKSLAEINGQIAAYQAGLPLTAPLLANAQLARILLLTTSAAQVAAVLAQPKPYRLGSKDTGPNDHMARVGEEGEEIVFMPKGSKVLPARQTRKYGEVLDAMFDNNLDKYVLRNYVTPALMEQKKKYESEKSRSFADNMAKSIYFNGLNANDMERIRKKGQAITNVDEIADAIAKKLPKFDIYR